MGRGIKKGGGGAERVANGEVTWLLRDLESPEKRFILGKLRNLWPYTALVLGIASERVILFVRDVFVHAGYRGSAILFECLRRASSDTYTSWAPAYGTAKMRSVRRHWAL